MLRVTRDNLHSARTSMHEDEVRAPSIPEKVQSHSTPASSIPLPRAHAGTERLRRRLTRILGSRNDAAAPEGSEPDRPAPRNPNEGEFPNYARMEQGPQAAYGWHGSPPFGNVPEYANRENFSRWPGGEQLREQAFNPRWQQPSRFLGPAEKRRRIQEIDREMSFLADEALRRRAHGWPDGSIWAEVAVLDQEKRALSGNEGKHYTNRNIRYGPPKISLTSRMLPYVDIGVTSACVVGLASLAIISSNPVGWAVGGIVLTAAAIGGTYLAGRWLWKKSFREDRW